MCLLMAKVNTQISKNLFDVYILCFVEMDIFFCRNFWETLGLLIFYVTGAFDQHMQPQLCGRGTQHFFFILFPQLHCTQHFNSNPVLLYFLNNKIYPVHFLIPYISLVIHFLNVNSFLSINFSADTFEDFFKRPWRRYW